MIIIKVKIDQSIHHGTDPYPWQVHCTMMVPPGTRKQMTPCSRTPHSSIAGTPGKQGLSNSRLRTVLDGNTPHIASHLKTRTLDWWVSRSFADKVRICFIFIRVVKFQHFRTIDKTFENQIIHLEMSDILRNALTWAYILKLNTCYIMLIETWHQDLNVV